MKPKIVETLDIDFTYKELETQMKLILEKEPELAATEWKVTATSEYKVNTSIQYQISDKYGEGRHFLIPNRKGIGIGKEKDDKKRRGLRLCSYEEFKKNNLTHEDIDLIQLLSHLKVFYQRKEKQEEEKEKQTTIDETKEM